MIERAVKLKDALELYQQHFRDDAYSPTQDDCLTNDDWYELKLLLDLLAPLRRQSLLVQHNLSGHGTMHEALSTLDLLMTKLEDFRRQHEYSKAQPDCSALAALAVPRISTPCAL
jgi:hypothetical protein